MARNYILGGMAGTQLQAGKPYFKRIVRINGSGYVNPALPAAVDPNNPQPGELEHSSNRLNRKGVSDKFHPDSEGYTVDVTTNGEITFNTSATNWSANGNRLDGELLMVEFPTTMRSVEIALEESWVAGVKQSPGDGTVRLKVMLTAEKSSKFQKTHFFDGDGNPDANSPLAKPIQNGNYIEVMQGETATISSRTKVVFILIQKFNGANILNPGDNDGFVTGDEAAAAGAIDDAVSILITGVLDHEPTSGGSQAANEPNSKVISDAETRTLRKIWGASDGIG